MTATQFINLYVGSESKYVLYRKIDKQLLPGDVHKKSDLIPEDADYLEVVEIEARFATDLATEKEDPYLAIICIRKGLKQ